MPDETDIENKEETLEENPENETSVDDVNAGANADVTGGDKGDAEDGGESKDDSSNIEDEDEPILDGDISSSQDDSDDEDFDPYDVEKAKNYIKKQTEKAAEPLKEQLFKQKVSSKVDKILAQNPEYAPYEKRIRKWVNHPNRVKMIRMGLPVETVVTEALAPYMQRIGARKAKEADSEANKTRSEGTNKSQVKADSNKNPYSNMSNDEIQRLADQVKSGRYKS